MIDSLYYSSWGKLFCGLHNKVRKKIVIHYERFERTHCILTKLTYKNGQRTTPLKFMLSTLSTTRMVLT